MWKIDRLSLTFLTGTDILKNHKGQEPLPCCVSVFVCVQHLIINLSPSAGPGTLDSEHMSAGLIAVYLRLSSNCRQITPYLRAPGDCHSDALHARLPPTRVGSVIHTSSPRRPDREWTEIDSTSRDNGPETRNYDKPICAAWPAEVI